MNNMIDLNWPFPSLKYPLTPPIAPIAPDYSDHALKIKTEIKTEVVPEDALL